MYFIKLNFLKTRPLLVRSFFNFHLMPSHTTGIMSFNQIFNQSSVCNFYHKRFFFFLPSIFFDTVGLVKKKQIKVRKALFRMKPGYQVLMRAYRSELIVLINLRFYRHKRITNWVMTGASIDTPIFSNNHSIYSQMQFSSPVNYIYNWKYMV